MGCCAASSSLTSRCRPAGPPTPPACWPSRSAPASPTCRAPHWSTPTATSTPASSLSELRAQAAASEDVGVIDFPTECQQTTDYDEVRRRVAGIPTADLRYLAILLYGPRRAVSRLTGNLALLR